MTDVYRVALIASHVIQYQDPFFRLLAAHPDVDLEVLFCSRHGAETYRDVEMQTTLKWDLPMLEGYRHRFLRDYGRGEGYARRINPAIVPAILFGRYDAVIFFLGWGTITSLLGLAACRMSGTPAMWFGDSAYPPPATSARAQLRAGFLRTLFRLADAYLVSGVLNAEYYAHYGAERDRFFPVPWAIDNARFFAASALTPDERRALRNKLGVRDDQVLAVFSAKFLPRKDPMTLLRAVARMQHRELAAILFLGEGELRAQMEAFAREHALDVHFAGFVNQTAMPRYYAAGDVFVLPSTYEPRGTVVNEAMACGLPVICSNAYGAIGDIVRDGDNAFVFPVGDADALAAKLDLLVENPSLRAAMASRSREIIGGWNYERGVEGIVEALRATC